MISCIVNTAALDAKIKFKKNVYREARYGERERLLEETVLPRVLDCGFDEVLVCGVWKRGDGYRYIPMKPRFRDRRDALWQRDLAARYSQGEILVFCHDDHMPSEDFVKVLKEKYVDDYDSWDILVPKRVHGVTGEELNNGKEDGYMGGHCLAMRRWLWAECPMSMVDTEFWDTHLSKIWLDKGAKMRHVDDLIHYDVEVFEHER